MALVDRGTSNGPSVFDVFSIINRFYVARSREALRGWSALALHG